MEELFQLVLNGFGDLQIQDPNNVFGTFGFICIVIVIAAALYQVHVNTKKIVTFSGPSGVGKSSLVKQLLKFNQDIQLVTSYTTRAQRESDLPGEYEYISRDHFAQLEAEGFFLETFHVHGNSYGTPKESIDKAVKSSRPSLMIVTPNAVSIISEYIRKEHGRDLVLPIYIPTPSEEILRERLKNRGDSAESIEKRIIDCQKWDEEAKASGIPFRTIKNDGTLSEALRAVSDELYDHCDMV